MSGNEVRANCPMLEGDRYLAVTALCERITHDFNNLMLPMIAYPPLLKRELRDGGRGGPIVDAIEQAAQSMLHINQQLMGLLPDSAGLQGAADLADGAQNAVQTVMGEGLPQGVEVSIAPLAGPVPVVGAPARLCRLIYILVKNGVESAAAKGGGSVTVHLEHVDVPAGCFEGLPTSAAHMVRVRVVDTGEGFDEAVGQRLFEPFHTTRRNAGRRGAGLGLSIAYRIAVDHGGWLTFMGRPREGATFSFYMSCPGETSG